MPLLASEVKMKYSCLLKFPFLDPAGCVTGLWGEWYGWRRGEDRSQQESPRQKRFRAKCAAQ